MNELDKKYILNKSLSNGIINIKHLSIQIEEMEKKDYLSKHTSRIWQNRQGHFLTYVEDEEKTHGRRLVNKKTLSELNDYLVKHYKSLEREPTVKQCFEEWLNNKYNYREISEATYSKYKDVFKRFFKDIERRKIRYIDAHDIEDFSKSAIRDKNLTSKGWSELRTLLYGIFRYAKRNDLTELSIDIVVKEMDIGKKSFKPRSFHDEEQVFEEEEVEKIYKYVFNREPTILMLGVILGFQTGLRVGEIATLKYSDLNGDVLHVCRTETRVKRNGKWIFLVKEQTKGRDGERKVVLTEGAKKTLKMARMKSMDSEWLFSKDGERILAKEYSKCLYRLCDHVGIPKRSMHKARKTYATSLLDSGVSSRIVMNQMGHTMIETTEAYYHFNNKNVNQVKEILTESLII